MSFFILFNNKFKTHNFEYLDGEKGNRLEKTLPKGMPKDQAIKSKSHFAIEVMSKGVQFVDEKLPINEAMRILIDKRIHHLPVRNQSNEICGLISDRDLLKLNGDKLFNLIQVKDIMSDLVLACHEETEISQVAKVLIHENISALPVINDSMKVTGIISRVDLLKCIVYQAKFFD